MNTPLPLTEKEKMVLEFIENFISETGVSPSYQEIRGHFGFASFNSVQNYLKQLANKGYIQIAENQKRSIQILFSANSVQRALQTKRVSPEPRRDQVLLQARGREEVLSLPLLGKVAAGQPLEAFEHNESVDVPPSMVRNPEKSFALRVSGQSMIDDGIFDGDIILVQKQNFASNGEIVVATVDNESTVKRFYLKPKPGERNKAVELRPANPSMSSMWFEPHQVDIRGIVVGLIRKF
jgi:repressor LexA